MVLLAFKCSVSPGRAKLWCCLRLNVSVPQGGRSCGVACVSMFPFPWEGEAVVLLAFKCFSSPGRARLWCCSGLNVSVPQGGRSCGVACV